MKNHWKSLLDKLDYKSGQSIIDVGGAWDPVPIADVIIDCCNLQKGGGEYYILDLCSDYFPFPDNTFDICICSQTLEDLACPTLALKEMSRVAKRGVIEVPHRGPESLKNTHYDGYPKPDYAMDEVWHFGTGHHKWLIEHKDEAICFTPKIQFMLMRHPIPIWEGPTGVSFYWEDSINYNITYDVFEEEMERNYKLFREENLQYIS